MAKKAPDPTPAKETAAASTGTSTATAIANSHLQAVNQDTPYGSISSEITGHQTVIDPYTGVKIKVPTRTITQTLSKDQQALLDKSTGAASSLADRVMAMLGQGGPQGADYSAIDLPDYQKLATGFGDAGKITKTYGTDFSEDRKRVEEAMLSRLNPEFARDDEALRTRLANQGIKAGSDAYSRELESAARSRDDARIGVVLAGGQEQSRLAELEAQRAGFQNAAQAQAYSQLLGRAGFKNAAISGNNAMAGQQFSDAMARAGGQDNSRSRWVSELAALLGRTQPTNPSFVNSQQPTIPTTDVAGIIGNVDQGKAAAQQADNAFYQNLFGGLLGLGAGAIGLSDERTKKDIQPVGEAQGHNLYAFRYRGEPGGGPKHIGVMAQEVEKKRPDAVFTGPDGFKRVKYGQLFGMAA